MSEYRIFCENNSRRVSEYFIEDWTESFTNDSGESSIEVLTEEMLVISEGLIPALVEGLAEILAAGLEEGSAGGIAGGIERRLSGRLNRMLSRRLCG